MGKDYRNLKIWKRSDNLAKAVYAITSRFPDHEQFGLTSQIRRAALAVPTNIVEGYYRTKGSFLNFLGIALGSLKETEYLLSFAKSQNYLSREEFEELNQTIQSLAKMLVSFKVQLSEK